MKPNKQDRKKKLTMFTAELRALLRKYGVDELKVVRQSNNDNVRCFALLDRSDGVAIGYFEDRWSLTGSGPTGDIEFSTPAQWEVAGR